MYNLQKPRPSRRNVNIRFRRRLLLVVMLLLVVVGGVVAWFRPQPTMQRAFVSPTAVPAPTSVARPSNTPTSVALQPEQEVEQPVSTVAPACFFDGQRLTYEPNFYVPQLQAWLDDEPGPLKTISFAVGDRRHTFAESLISQASYYSLNPKVILALLELQSGLISNPQPSAEQLAWAIGFRGEEGKRRGVQAQVRWAVRRAVYAKRDFPSRANLVLADNTTMPPAADIEFGEYIVAAMLAPTTTPDQLPGLLARFSDTYTRLFGDPRQPPADWPAPGAPFLSWPMERGAAVTSFFDHEAPFLTRVPNAPVLTYWGRDETDIAFAYDGHDGWDYALAPPDVAVAAADGKVVFVGNADDNCASRAVVIDHGNGYRTIYWHLSRVLIAIGDRVMRGEHVGVIGESGCVTGPHLHFGVQFLGRNTDPYGWCAPTPDPWAVHPAGSESRWLWSDRPSPCGPPPAGSVVVDTNSPGFRRTGDGWNIIIPGFGGDALAIPSLQRPPPPTFTPDPALLPPTATPTTRVLPTELPATPSPSELVTPTVVPTPATATWTARVPTSGRYRVLAYVPYALSGLDDARDVRYFVRSADGETEVVVNQFVSANDWADLGTYTFSDKTDAVVRIDNQTEAPNRSVWADAIIWIPAE